MNAERTGFALSRAGLWGAIVCFAALAGLLNLVGVSALPLPIGGGATVDLLSRSVLLGGLVLFCCLAIAGLFTAQRARWRRARRTEQDAAPRPRQVPDEHGFEALRPGDPALPPQPGEGSEDMSPAERR